MYPLWLLLNRSFQWIYEARKVLLSSGEKMQLHRFIVVYFSLYESKKRISKNRKIAKGLQWNNGLVNKMMFPAFFLSTCSCFCSILVLSMASYQHPNYFVPTNVRKRLGMKNKYFQINVYWYHNWILYYCCKINNWFSSQWNQMHAVLRYTLLTI